MPPWEGEETINDTPSDAFHATHHYCFASFGNYIPENVGEAEAPSLPYASVASDPWLASDPWGAAAQRSVASRAAVPTRAPLSFSNVWNNYSPTSPETTWGQWQDYLQRAPRPPSPRGRPPPPKAAPAATPKTAGLSPPRVVADDDELSAHSWAAGSQDRENDQRPLRPTVGEGQRAEPNTSPFHLRTSGNPISMDQLERILLGQQMVVETEQIETVVPQEQKTALRRTGSCNMNCLEAQHPRIVQLHQPFLDFSPHHHAIRL